MINWHKIEIFSGGAAAICLALSACSGGGSSSSSDPVSPAPAPIPPPVQTPTPATIDYAPIQQAAQNFSVNGVTVLIGDTNGVIFTFERGNITATTEVQIASASKMFFGWVIWGAIEDGHLSLNTNPQNVIAEWPGDDTTGRSDITLDQLLGFTSGFNNPPAQPGCISNASFSLSDCVSNIFDGGIDGAPGAEFYYGPEHMQIAALMTVRASGSSINELMNEYIKTPLGLSASTYYPSLENTRYSGSMRSTAADYGLVLQAIMSGEFIQDRDAYLTDRTANVTFGSRPNNVGGTNRDWHYGFGFWKECDLPNYAQECDDNPIISSPGAFGFTPWIDFENGYWGIVAIENFGLGAIDPVAVSVELEQEIQELMETALQQ